MFLRFCFTSSSIDAIDEGRQGNARPSGHGESAGRQRHAGQRVAAHRCREQRLAEPVIGHELVDLHALALRHVGDDQVLVRREPEVALVDGGDLLEAGEMQGAGLVGDAAGLDAQRQVPAGRRARAASRSDRPAW
jgi:hypothetical protein